MARLFWDASALVKRYTLEVGTPTANALFNARAQHALMTTPWGYVETYSALLRRLNSRALDPRAFVTSITSLRAEVVDAVDFNLLSITNNDIFACIAPMRQHNLNATDAAILTMLLDYVAATAAEGPLLVIAADQRLLRAAEAEGLPTLNPETLPPDDLPAFLARL